MSWAKQHRGPGPFLAGKVSLGRMGQVGTVAFLGQKSPRCPVSAASLGNCCCRGLVPVPVLVLRDTTGTPGPFAISSPY